MIVDVLGKKVDYQAYKDSLYRDKMMCRLRESASFKKVLLPAYNKTNGFIEDMRNVVNPKFHFEENSIWVMSGETGSGKTISVMSLLRLILNRKNIWELFCFTDKQLLDLADQFERDIFLCRDEDVTKAIYGEGSNRTSMQLEVMAETCRKAGISLCFIAPQETSSGIAKYFLETVDMDIKHRITRVALREPKTMQYLGALYIPIIKNDDNDWVQYSAMKDAFISRMRQGEIDDSKIDLHYCVEKVITHEDFVYRRTKGERRVLIQELFPNYTLGEIKTISVLLEIKLRKQKSAEAR